MTSSPTCVPLHLYLSMHLWAPIFITPPLHLIYPHFITVQCVRKPFLFLIRFKENVVWIYMVTLSQSAWREDEATEVSILREVQWRKVNWDSVVILYAMKSYVNPLILYPSLRWWGVVGVTPHALSRRNSSHCSLNRSLVEPYSWLDTLKKSSYAFWESNIIRTIA
jgi:hypothetical protein